jgi:hypothetical protein
LELNDNDIDHLIAKLGPLFEDFYFASLLQVQHDNWCSDVREGTSWADVDERNFLELIEHPSAA